MTADTKTSNRGRKIKAVLAGGVVLGVGAAVTLAAWTDQEWAEGIFGAGDFNIEGSTDGETWADHESEDGAAELGFDLDAASNLSPGDTVAAPFVLRTDAATTYAATVSLENVTTEGDNAANLTYGIVQVDSAASCTEGATGTEIVPGGTALDAAPTATTFDLAEAPSGTAGAPTTLCFVVTAGSGLAEGGTATAHWDFVAESVEAA